MPQKPTLRSRVQGAIQNAQAARPEARAGINPQAAKLAQLREKAAQVDVKATLKTAKALTPEERDELRQAATAFVAVGKKVLAEVRADVQESKPKSFGEAKKAAIDSASRRAPAKAFEVAIPGLKAHTAWKNAQKRAEREQ